MRAPIDISYENLPSLTNKNVKSKSDMDLKAIFSSVEYQNDRATFANYCIICLKIQNV